MEQLEDRSLLATIFVDDDASAGGNGEAWGTAYNDLQAALTTATSGDEIWVAAGTYRPTTGSNRSVSFNLKNGVSLYGGFGGTESLLTERDWLTNVTTLSGDIGATGNNADNSLHVVMGVTGATLDGFVITGGNATVGGGYDEYGGGILNDGSSPTLANLTLHGNSANYGGAIVNYNSSSPTLTNVTVSDNSATQQGGGMYNHFSSPTLTNVLISGNAAGVHGGGIHNDYSSPTLTKVTLSGNSAAYGGGIYNVGGTVAVNSSTLSGNTAFGSGGGIYNAGSLTITTSILVGNSAGAAGGGLAVFGTTSITASTIAANTAHTGGGIDNYWGEYSLSLLGSIVAENTATGGYGPDVANAVISNGYNLIGNSQDSGGWIASDLQNIDPLFVNAPGGDVHLRPGSPAIDAGTNAGAPLVDLDGCARPQDGDGNGSATTDMGAFEYLASAILYVNDDATGLNTGTSWGNAFTSLQTALSVANTDDEIWVAAGTYKPTTGADRAISFNLKSGVGLYGGFAGNESALTERNWVTNVTTLSGDIGTAGSSADNSYHVIYASGVSNAIVDGFTVTAGNANGPPNANGGGFYISYSSALLTNLTITANSTSGYGGGIVSLYSSPILSRVRLSGNVALYGGGGVYVYSSPARLQNVEFFGNSAGFGGGLDINTSNPNLTNVSFSANSAVYRGGGIAIEGGYFTSPSYPVLTNAILWGNSAPSP